MHIFHSRENIKTCIFTAVKIQDLIFSRENNRKIGTTFFLFSQYDLREAIFYGISVPFLRETTIDVSIESLRSLIKERAFINLSATTKIKTKANVK